MQITFELSSPSDRALVRDLLDKAEREASGSGHTAESGDGGDVERQVREMFERQPYGDIRHRLVRMIAEASPASVSKTDVYAAANELSPGKNPSLILGGLHSSLERSWRSVGGRGMFFDTSLTSFNMSPRVAKATLAVLDALEGNR